MKHELSKLRQSLDIIVTTKFFVKDLVPNTLDDENVLVSNLQLAILKLNPQHFF